MRVRERCGGGGAVRVISLHLFRRCESGVVLGAFVGHQVSERSGTWADQPQARPHKGVKRWEGKWGWEPLAPIHEPRSAVGHRWWGRGQLLLQSLSRVGMRRCRKSSPFAAFRRQGHHGPRERGQSERVLHARTTCTEKFTLLPQIVIVMVQGRHVQLLSQIYTHGEQSQITQRIKLKYHTRNASRTINMLHRTNNITTFFRSFHIFQRIISWTSFCFLWLNCLLSVNWL
jgi:hypothetical protein